MQVDENFANLETKVAILETKINKIDIDTKAKLKELTTPAHKTKQNL